MSTFNIERLGRGEAIQNMLGLIVNSQNHFDVQYTLCFLIDSSVSKQRTQGSSLNTKRQTKRGTENYNTLSLPLPATKPLPYIRLLAHFDFT